MKQTRTQKKPTKPQPETESNKKQHYATRSNRKATNCNTKSTTTSGSIALGAGSRLFRREGLLSMISIGSSLCWLRLRLFTVRYLIHCLDYVVIVFTPVSKLNCFSLSYNILFLFGSVAGGFFWP